MVEEDAVGGQLGRVAAGHHVQQQPPAQRLVERGSLARGGHRRAQRGAQRHQQLDALCDGRQARGRHPGVKAGAAGGNEQAVVAQVFGGDGDLAHVRVGGRTTEVRGAEVACIARCGQEPENLRRGSGGLGHRKSLSCGVNRQGTGPMACAMRAGRLQPRGLGLIREPRRRTAKHVYRMSLCVRHKKSQRPEGRWRWGWQRR